MSLAKTNWLQSQSNGIEFVNFMQQPDRESAMAEALKKCSDEKGVFSYSRFDELKASYLEFCRKTWGLTDKMCALNI